MSEKDPTLEAENTKAAWEGLKGFGLGDEITAVEDIAAKFPNLTIKDLGPVFAKMYIGGDFTISYTLHLCDGQDSNIVTTYYVDIENGKYTFGEGESKKENPVVFFILQNWVKTMLLMQVGGLKAAQVLMINGFVYTRNIAGAQKWFELFKIGVAETNEALKEALG